MRLGFRPFLRGTGHERFARIKRRMIPVSKLRSGQSPWDDLTKEDLLFLVWSYHQVAQSSLSALESNTFPGSRSGFCDEAIGEARAAVDSVFSGYTGPSQDGVRLGGRAVPGMARDQSEHFYRTVMRPVMGCLAFDVPSWLWWICSKTDSLAGLPGQNRPACECKGNAKDGRPCDQHLLTWDEWRAVAKLPVQEEAA